MSNRRRSNKTLGGYLTGLFRASQSNSQSTVRGQQELLEAIRAADGAGGSGAIVNDETAMRVAAVYACVRVLSEAIASLPFNLFLRDGTDATVADGHATHDILAHRPNDWQTPFEFKRLAAVCILTKGNFYAQKVTRGDNVVALNPIDPGAIEPEQQADLSIRYKYTRKGAVSYFRQDEIFHIRALSLDGVRGLGPIQAAKRDIGLSMQMGTWSERLMSNGVKPSGVLMHPETLSDEAFNRLKQSFGDEYGGVDNSHKPMILEEGLKWEAVSITPEDAQFIESQKFTRAQIAMFFGVPPHMIGDIERGTSWGSGIEQQNIGFLTYALKPWLVNYQESVQRDLLTREEQRTHFAKFDTSDLTRADFGSRQTGLNVQYQAGVISANEWRRIENMNPRDGGDTYKAASEKVQSVQSAGK